MSDRKWLKRICALCLCLALLTALFPSALAEEAAADPAGQALPEQTETAESETGEAGAEDSLPEAENPEDAESQSEWEARLLRMLEEHGADPSTIGAGYYNFATGEEHYYNGDEYRVSGSMYKVPLNMLYLDWIADGSIEPDELIYGFRYSELLEGTIIDSNNDYARTMWTYAGEKIQTNPASTAYHRYRILIAPLMGEDPENVDDKYYENNFFTPRQMITCLRRLYDGGEKYDRLIETMQRAEPEKYFKLRERRFNIAHKYGWFAEDPILYLNDCALCFTDDPIAIVLFTTGTAEAYGVLTDYCTLMCDYAQETHAARVEREAAEAAALLEAEEKDRLAAKEAEKEKQNRPDGEKTAAAARPAAESASTGTEKEREHVLPTGALAALMLIIAGTVTALVLLVIRRHKNRFPLGYAAAAVFLTAAALLACFPAVNGWNIVSVEEEDPTLTLEIFFRALQRGDFEAADRCLAGESSLGLAAPAGDELLTKALGALEKSWDYQLSGDCTVEKTTAWQNILLQTLDFSAMEQDIQRETREQLLEIARNRNRSLVYDEEGNYLPEIAGEAYDLALSAVLDHAEEYSVPQNLRIELTRTRDSWKIVPNDELMAALCGYLRQGA